MGFHLALIMEVGCIVSDEIPANPVGAICVIKPYLFQRGKRITAEIERSKTKREVQSLILISYRGDDVIDI